MFYHVIYSVGHDEKTFESTGGKGVIVNGIEYEEYDANRDVGSRVISILREHGLKVFDIQKSLPNGHSINERVAKANRIGAKLYWSSHFNAGDPDAKGVCAFFWHSNNTTQALAEQYARNAEDEGIETHGNGTHPSRLGSWTNLAEVRDTHMDAILTENGFMTNPDDFENIFGKNKEAYHQKIAEVQAKTILSYFGIDFRPVKTAVIEDNEEDIDLDKYKELKEEIAELKSQVKSKLNEPSDSDKPSEWAKASWIEAEKNGYFDGKRPHDYITREEAAIVVNRLRDNILELVYKHGHSIDAIEKKLSELIK